MIKKIIGLCGGSGSGKGTVGKTFSDNGYLVIDTDKVYRELTDTSSPCLLALIDEFGREILNSNGGLDRKKLASVVFSNRKKHTRLNEISHKFVLREVREKISTSLDKYCGAVVDAPMLYESGFDKECDCVLAVICDREARIERIILRDNIPRDAAIKRIDSQITDAELISKADFVIENNSDLNSLKLQVEDIIKKLK